MNRRERFFNYHRGTNLSVLNWLIFISIVLWGLGYQYEHDNRVQKLHQQLLKQQKQIITLQQEVVKARIVKRIMDSYQCQDMEIYQEVMATWDPVTVAIVIGIESEYRQYAVSSCGCYGLMQISWRHGLKEPFSIRENIRFGAQFLKEQYLKFKTLDKAIWAFNAGPEMVGKYLPRETKAYIARVKLMKEIYQC